MQKSKIFTTRKLAHSKMAYTGAPRLLKGQLRWTNPEVSQIARAAHEAAMDEAKTANEVLSFAALAARAASYMS